MALVLRIPAKYEDRFAIMVRDFINRNPKFGINKLEDLCLENNHCNFYINIHASLYNQFFLFLEDCKNIMDIPIKFRYCYNKVEAYKGHDEHNMFNHLWLTLDRSDYDN